MSRPKVGRPKAEEGDSGTAHVRVFSDIAEMLSDLVFLLPMWKTSQILDPLIRPEVTRLWEKYKPQIEKAKASQSAANEELEKVRTEAAKLADAPKVKRPRAE